jgi:hypothetical protein
MKITKNAIEFHVDTVDDLANLPGEDKQVCIVSDEDRGGVFVYNSSKSSENDGGIVFNGWVRKYEGPVNVKWFGAKGDGVTDNSNIITNLMNMVSSSTSSTVIKFPEGVFVVDDIRIPTGVILKGVAPMNGWTRLSGDYTKGSVLKLKDGSNNNVLFIENSTQNCGIINLIIDGNKSNQTDYKSNCLYIQATDFRAFGVVIKGNKFVNAKGWGVYANSPGPIEFEDNFVMSGAFFSGTSDYKIRGNTFDGTDGLHPALLMHRARHGSLNDNIIYGWGEDGTTDKTLQTIDVTIDSNTNVLTATTGIGWLYEGAPIVISSTGTMPSVNGASDYRVYFVSQISGDTFKLESNIPLTSGSTTVDFATSGTGTITIGHGGSNTFEETVRFDICNTMRCNNNRIAGSKGSHLVMNLTNDVKVSNNIFYSSNHRGLSSIAALEMIDCQKNGFSTNNFGVIIGETAKYDYIIHLEDSGYLTTLSTPTSSRYNKFDMSNNYLSSLTGILIKDDTVQSYKDRNIFDGIDGIADAGTQRISSPNFFREPFKNVIAAEYATQAIPNDSTTLLPLIPIIELGGTVNTNDIQIETTADGLYNVSGQITIEGYANTISVANLTFSGFSTSIKPIRRISATVSGAENNTRMTIPFNFYFHSTVDGISNLQSSIYIYNAGDGTYIKVSPEYSFINIVKISETTREN